MTSVLNCDRLRPMTAAALAAITEQADHFSALDTVGGDGDHGITMARAMGLELDASGFGMGKRCKRFAAIVDNGVVSYLGVEPAGEVGVSSADAVLAAL